MMMQMMAQMTTCLTLRYHHQQMSLLEIHAKPIHALPLAHLAKAKVEKTQDGEAGGAAKALGTQAGKTTMPEVIVMKFRLEAARPPWC